jgi:hypothetical protein
MRQGSFHVQEQQLTLHLNIIGYLRGIKCIGGDGGEVVGMNDDSHVTQVHEVAGVVAEQVAAV